MTDPIINRESRPKIEQQVLTMQIITGAMLTGVVAFAMFAFMSPAANNVEQPFMSYVAAAFACGAIVTSFFAPAIIGQGLVKQALSANPRNVAKPDSNDLVLAYQTRMIIGLAILEGAAFFCVTAYMIERQWWTLAAASVMCLLMLIRFPTRGRVDDWCRVQLENASVERSS